MKRILITGAFGGLGGASTKFFAENGWQVFALDYNINGAQEINHPNVVPIQVDVTSSESIENSFSVVSQHTDELDVVVNFAGILTMGSVLELPVSEMQRILDINLLGMYRVNQQFFPMIAKAKGRIINISSETGVLSPAPFSGFYYLSKRAVEIYSDALRRELKYLGIPVVKIRPGAFKTNMQGAVEAVMEKTINETKYFNKQLSKGKSLAKNEAKNAKDPKLLAALVFKVANSRKPKIAYGLNLNWQLKFVSALPARLQDFIYYQVLK
ncbi:MAG TPA: SDR family NAD(P)-dependent oxidoreductase [Taishania sp.]|nr:SDR family NAD(P)-dependent oxidoreductase [Taishania sp.]